jgi:predicted acetyltransferase
VIGYRERVTDGELPIRPGTADDFDPVMQLGALAFHSSADAEQEALERAIYEPERALVVQDGDDVVGHALALSREVTVPGAVVAAAHVTGVYVRTTHRRRRLLSRMMHRQLREVRDGGSEPVAVLWASEGRIYPRFGYGLATEQLSLEVDSRETLLRADWQRPAPEHRGRLRWVSPSGARKELAALYERLRPERPGWSSRDERHWAGLLAETRLNRGEATELRAVLHETADGPTGYALWRVRRDWNAAGPQSEVIVVEAAAADPYAYAALWELLLGIDLTRRVRYRFAALDEPLLHLVPELGRLTARLDGSLWLRIVDLPEALTARRYAAPVDAVLEVDDPLLPENAGRWRLVGDGSSANCTPSAEPADLACGIAELGAVYLGGPSLSALAAAGRVRELRPGALRRASAAFGWHRAPASIEVF